MPGIIDFIKKIAQCKLFSTIDVKSAYHWIPIYKDDKLYTAFKSKCLYHFNCMPFGITYGPLCFEDK